MAYLDSPGARLRHARQKAGYASAAEFAKKMQIKVVTYRAYENDQNKYADLAPDFAKKLGVTTDWLLRGGSEPEIGDIRTPERIQMDAKDGTVFVRQVDISYAMGDGALIEDYPETGLIPFDANQLRVMTRAPVDALFFARGEGDSMQPTILHGDPVLVDASQTRIAHQDRIWAVMVAGAGMIKRVRRIPGDRYQILSDNPSVPPQEVGADDLHVIGRVILIWRAL